MRITQTFSELGLENGAIALWSEPKVGQKLRPKFGSRSWLKKPLYAVLLAVGYFLFINLTKGHLIYSWDFLFPIILVAIAWPLASALDYMNRRNIWVYPDRILVTHGSARTTLVKSKIKQIFIYRAKSPNILAMELLTVKGISTVVGMPNEEGLPEFLATLQQIGYPIRNELGDQDYLFSQAP